ncbi:MAG: nitronate monooxygenase [Dehalococcoidia bacterium]
MASRTLRTPLCDLLGIEYPIIQAGTVPGGVPELVTAVSNAGGLGVLGASGAYDIDGMREAIRRIRASTARPFGVDLLLPARLETVDEDLAKVKRAVAQEYPAHAALVRGIKEEFNVPDATAPDYEVRYTPDFIRRQVAVVLEEQVPIFVAALGDPAWMVPDAHAQGMKVIGMAGSVRNALRQLKAGVDIVVAQGHEGGGHTGRIATMVLVPQVVDAIAPTPVVAAGGIADGRGVAAALALGAVGVWCGTAFLASEEAGITPLHRQRILEGRDQDFVVSRIFSGKPARSYKIPLIDRWNKSGLEPLPMPLQGLLQDDVLYGAEEADIQELISSSAGQSAGLVSKIRPARVILEEMVQQASDILNRLGSEVAQAG